MASQRPLDAFGDPVQLHSWYWWKDATGLTIGTGKFACNAGKDNWTFFINGTGYQPSERDAFRLAGDPSWQAEASPSPARREGDAP